MWLFELTIGLDPTTACSQGSGSTRSTPSTNSPTSYDRELIADLTSLRFTEA